MQNYLPLIFLFLSTTAFAQTFTNYTEADGLISSIVNCLALDANDQVWFGTQNGVSHFDGSQWTNYDTESHPNLVNNTIKAIATDIDGNVWVGTDFGVSKFDGTDWTTYTEEDGLADNRVKHIAQDETGSIWFGNNDGVSIFDGSNWISFTMEDGLPFGGVNYIAPASDGQVWLGTGLGGIRIFDGANFTAITEEEGLLNDKVRSIAIAPDGQKWVGTSDGISVFDTNNELAEQHTRMFFLPEPDTLNPVEDVQIDSEGNVWAAIYVDYLVTEGGISTFNDFGWYDYDVDDGLIGPVVRRIAIDSEDHVWVTTSTGVSKVTDITTSTTSLEHKASMRLYPNPSSGWLNIELPSDLSVKNQHIKIYNSTMQLVQEHKVVISQSWVSISLENLDSGVYFVQVGNIVEKVVKF